MNCRKSQVFEELLKTYHFFAYVSWTISDISISRILRTPLNIMTHKNHFWSRLPPFTKVWRSHYFICYFIRFFKNLMIFIFMELAWNCKKKLFYLPIISISYEALGLSFFVFPTFFAKLDWSWIN